MSPQVPRRQKSLPTAGSSTNTALKVRICLRATVASRFGSTLEVSLFVTVIITDRPRNMNVLQYFRPNTELSKTPFYFCTLFSFQQLRHDSGLLCSFNHVRNFSTKSSVCSMIFTHFLQPMWWKRNERAGKLSVDLSSFKTGLWNLTSHKACPDKGSISTRDYSILDISDGTLLMTDFYKLHKRFFIYFF